MKVGSMPLLGRSSDKIFALEHEGILFDMKITGFRQVEGALTIRLNNNKKWGANRMPSQ